MKYDLLPCPFCANREVRLVKARSNSFVICESCECYGPAPSDTGDEREAVALWNQRLDSEREE